MSLVRLTADYWIGIIVVSRPNDRHSKQFVISIEEAIKFNRYDKQTLPKRQTPLLIVCVTLIFRVWNWKQITQWHLHILLLPKCCLCDFQAGTLCCLFFFVLSFEQWALKSFDMKFPFKWNDSNLSTLACDRMRSFYGFGFQMTQKWTLNFLNMLEHFISLHASKAKLSIWMANFALQFTKSDRFHND